MPKNKSVGNIERRQFWSIPIAIPTQPLTAYLCLRLHCLAPPSSAGTPTWPDLVREHRHLPEVGHRGRVLRGLAHCGQREVDQLDENDQDRGKALAVPRSVHAGHERCSDGCEKRPLHRRYLHEHSRRLSIDLCERAVLHRRLSCEQRQDGTYDASANYKK